MKEKKKKTGLVLAAILTAWGLLPTSAQELDLSQHSVPLDEVLLDTFIRGRPPVPLSKASPELINKVRDGIPPLNHPEYISSKKAGFLRDDDWVIGIEIGGDVRAYPVRILNYHEIVNDTVGGEPILVSYCPLCRSGIVYSRRVGARVLSFGNTSALYQSDMVMVDHQTNSWWYQVEGVAIVGRLTGRRLNPLPSMMSTWDQWRSFHPDGLVLSAETGADIDYGTDPYGDRYRFSLNSRRRAPFPTSKRVFHDHRVRPAARILGLVIKGKPQAYRLEPRGTKVVNDMVEDLPFVIFMRHGAGAAYVRQQGERLLKFNVKRDEIIDNQTGSRWNLTGQAIDGTLAGTELKPLPTRSTYWFAWVAAFPDTLLCR